MTLGGVRLSPQQRRLWTLQEGDGQGAPAYVAACALSLDGPVDTSALEAACADLAARHEILRTCFRRLPGVTVPLQFVQETARVGLEEVDLTGRTNLEIDCRVEQLLQQGVIPADLESGPLLRATSIVLERDRRMLVIHLPALCTDAAGLRIIARDFLRLYEARVGGGEGLGDVAQYADLSEWMNDILEAEETEAGRRYWSGLEIAELLGCSLPRIVPAVGPFLPSVVKAASLADSSALQARAGGLGVESEDLLLACWMALLGLRTGRREALSGVLLEGRDYAELEDAAGFFARVVPVRAELGSRCCFRSLVEEVGKSLGEVRTWQECFHWDLLQTGEGRGGEAPFFPFLFELLDGRGTSSAGDVRLSLDRLRVCGERFEAKLTCSWRDEGLAVALEHDRSRLSVAEAHLLLERFRAILDQVLLAADVEVGALEALANAERHRLLVELNDTAVEEPAESGVHRMFERRAMEHPERPAVTFGERILSYGDLDAAANRLAMYLEDLGAMPGAVIPICVERSPEMLTALLAVLKIGAAYAPLDPNQPAERLASMLAELAPPLVVSEERWLGGLPHGAARIVCLDRDRPEIDRQPSSRRSPEVRCEQLAYVIFTSGSTGRPKGVAVEHRQLIAYLQAISDPLGLPAEARFGMVSTFAADLGHTVLFPALTSGGCLDILPLERVSDPVAFAEHFRRRPVDCLKVVPSHLRALLSASNSPDVLPRRFLVLGGEASSWELVEQIRALEPECSILNHYGPTETTVGVLTYPVGERTSGSGAKVPLGRPLANTLAYVLDHDLRPVPPGIAGEVFIGGSQLARGYLGCPDATSERFLPDPLTGVLGARLYRTGDMARRLPDGSLEFLGRTDHQVKIRGFRIELGEIESVLGRHPSVRQALVMARQQGGNNPRLVAYLTFNGAKPTLYQLRDHVSRSLPDFMVPSAFVPLDAFPLTPNGKIDLQVLPEPEKAGLCLAGERAAPRTPTEEILATIWREVLGLPEIGVYDNFFELGGDSILVIRIAAKANQAGVRIVPRQMFEHQTIASLAVVAGTISELDAEQGVVEGPVPLTPIQHLFFEQELAEPHHWNQSLMLKLHRLADPARLAAVVCRLVEHHDALRLRFVRDGAMWRQHNARPDGSTPFAWVDLASLPAGSWLPALEEAADQVQRSLNLTSGPLIRAVLFDLDSRSNARLLLAVHHLVVDGVSWRILLEDLERSYQQLANFRPIDLPPKGTSFQRWAQRLCDRAGSEEVESQLVFWLRVPEGRRLRLALDHPLDDGPFAIIHDVVVQLEPHATYSLIQEAPKAYHTQLEDLLLTALVRALRARFGDGLLLLDLERHGRESIFPDVDVSRTIGWFTTIFPVWLGATTGGDFERDIKLVKEQLRAVSSRGIDFGALRYLSADKSVRESLRSLPTPELRFNYLGRLDGVLSETSEFLPAAESRGTERSPRAPSRYLLDLVVWVSGDRLQVSWNYDGRLFRRETVEALAQGYVVELRALIEHCRTLHTAAFTPSDFPEAGLTQETLDTLMQQLGEAGGF